MSKISDKLSYPEASPIQGADYLIGTDADSSPIEKQTKTFTISDLKDFIIDGLFDGVSYRIPVFTAASAGADSEKIVSSLISQDTAQQSGSAVLGTTVTIDNGSGAGSLIVADAFTPFGVSTFEGDAFFKTNATINPDANLYLLGKIYDANSSVGNNEQVLVSDSLGNVTWQNFQGSGLEFQGAWDARTIAEGGVTDGGNPNLQNIQLIAGNTGKYWVVSTAGTASLQGQTTPITQWSPGDWAIISEDDAGNIFWDKIDNSSVDGGGTTNNMAMWTASKVLGNAAPVSMIQDPNNNNLTIGNGGGEEVVIESILSLQGAVKDTTASLGTQNDVLVSNSSGQLEYQNINTFDVESAEKIIQTVRFAQAVNVGDPVYITGYNNGQNLTEVEKAFASDPTKMAAIGLAVSNQAQNTTGEIIVAGDFPDFNTASYSVGDSLYVAANGGLTNVKPITPNLIQKIAVVSRSNVNNGDIEVFALGRENDVPNLPEGKIFVGSALNTITSESVFINESIKSVILNDNSGTNTASGTRSTSIGNGTTASGDNSFASGLNTTASGSTSIAMGEGALASNIYSVAIGNGVTSNADSSLALGKNTTASGNQSTAMGDSTIASGPYSTAMGGNTTASGNYSTAMGSSTTASGNNSTAMGSSTTAIGNNSISGGFSSVVRANSRNSIAFGNNAIAGLGISDFNENVAFGFETLAGGSFGAFAMGWRAFNVGSEGLASGHGSFVSGHGSGALGEGVSVTDIAAGVVNVSVGIPSTSFQLTNVIGGANIQPGDTVYNNGSGNQTWTESQDNRINTVVSATFNSGTPAGDVYTIVVNSPGFILDAGETVSFSRNVNATEGSFAIGAQSVTLGNRSISLGYLAKAESNQSVAIGEHAWTKNQGSVSIGRYAIDNATNQVAIGGDNIRLNAYGSGGNPGTPVFALGVTSFGEVIEFSAVDIDNYVDGGTYSGGTLTLERTGTLGDIDISGFLEIGTGSTQALAGNTTTISAQQASDISANNLKVSFPEAPTDGQQYARQNSGWSVVSGGGGGGTVTGTGTTNTLPIWSDGPNGVLSDSGINQLLDAGNNLREVNITTTSGISSKWNFNGAGNKFLMESGIGTDVFTFSGDNTGFYANNFQMRGTLAVGKSQQSTAVTLDVGNSGDTRPAAWFRNGVVLSNNPSGVSVDNTSMVIGGGNNDIVSGSDSCLAVGNGNQILSNSDNSLAVGQSNIISNQADNSFAIGLNNTIDGTGATEAVRSQVLGFNNNLTGSYSSFIAGGQNTVTTSQNAVALGFSHVLGGADSMFAFGENNTGPSGATDNNSFMIGGNLTGIDGNMALGFRNDTSSYPVTDYSLGLGNTKFALAVGSDTTTNSNALLITEGGVTRGVGVAQVPRIVLPTIGGFSATDDTAAGAIGIPLGGLYQSNGSLRINTGSVIINQGSWTPTISAIGGSNFSFNPIAGGSNIGYYVIEGDIVNAWFVIPGTANWTGTSGFPLITGLPYAYDNTLIPNISVLSADISKTQGLSAQATGVSSGPSNTSLGINVLINNNSTNMALNGTGIVSGTFFSLSGCIRYKLL
jgi:hypothetical protein